MADAVPNVPHVQAKFFTKQARLVLDYSGDQLDLVEFKFKKLLKPENLRKFMWLSSNVHK